MISFKKLTLIVSLVAALFALPGVANATYSYKASSYYSKTKVVKTVKKNKAVRKNTKKANKKPARKVRKKASRSVKKNQYNRKKTARVNRYKKVVKYTKRKRSVAYCPPGHTPVSEPGMLALGASALAATYIRRRVKKA